MAQNGAADQFVGLEAVHHGNMGGEITAPAHTHSGEDGNVAAVDETLTDQLADQTEGSTGST